MLYFEAGVLSILPNLTLDTCRRRGISVHQCISLSDILLGSSGNISRRRMQQAQLILQQVPHIHISQLDYRIYTPLLKTIPRFTVIVRSTHKIQFDFSMKLRMILWPFGLTLKRIIPASLTKKTCELHLMNEQKNSSSIKRS